MAGSNGGSRGNSYPWAPMTPGLFSRLGTAGPLASIGHATVATPKPLTPAGGGAKTGPTITTKK